MPLILNGAFTFAILFLFKVFYKFKIRYSFIQGMFCIVLCRFGGFFCDFLEGRGDWVIGKEFSFHKDFDRLSLTVVVSDGVMV